MDNLFIKEVINGKVVEIERMTVGKMMKAAVEANGFPEHEKTVHLMCSVVKIDGIKLDSRKFLESDDFEVFNFISESFTAMTKNNLL